MAAKKRRSAPVTSHGKPAAETTPRAEEARSALFARLKKQRVEKTGRWTRDELYDDSP